MKKDLSLLYCLSLLLKEGDLEEQSRRHFCGTVCTMKGLNMTRLGVGFRDMDIGLSIVKVMND
jgi:hypothetical protein